MAKRQATEQITRDDFNENLQEHEEANGRPIKASSQVLSSRKILKPRSKLGGDQNGFASTPFKVQQSSFNFAQPSKPTNEKDNKIKALNDNFIQKINELNKSNTITNFTKIAEKYIAYFKEIENSDTTKSQKSQSLPPPKIEQIDEIQDAKSDVESEEEKKQVKIQGPTFSFNNSSTVTKSPFTFDPKKIAKINAPDSDESEDEVQIKGPTFQFNKEIKDNVFKLPTNSTSTSFFKPSTTEPQASQVNNTSTTFKFGAGTDQNSQEPSKSPFSFTSTSKQTDPEKPVSFGSTNSNSAFSFGTSQPTDSSKSVFSFSKPSTGSSETSKAFSFISPDATAKKEDAVKSSGFSFPKPTEQNNAFSFGETKKSVDAGSSTETSKDFSFKPAESNKPFSFGATSQPSEKAFSFGAKSTSANKDTESNNTPSNQSESTKPSTFTFPKFNESGQKDSTDKPSSLFGAKPSSNFSFTPASSTTTNSAFSFTSSNTNTTSAFNFKPSSNTLASNSNPFGGINNNKENQNTEESVEEHEVDTNFTPITQMNEKQDTPSGEENEETKYTIRAKLMEFNASDSTNPYVNKGLGDLKILHNKITGKSRILIRAEGSMRVLLNTLISKDISYDSIGNGNLIRVPVFENNKVVTYIIKVKTADDGKILLHTINESK
ncbi:uncharacterized protein KGF55_002007 [Candida pseudojiufengensis]|uniref:uncharacterized protein n=1 Tax=Candida pseudojiufengensis TaxID=497109 RepID=UPI002224040B|nr:uncharacterized protein KGF55_002007 [Candida pseudojiufengensis]KAI5964065.1 hypothetical protein KGF55_002007 [Candida pseudojiufengensis]